MNKVLYTGTNIINGKNLLKRKFNVLSWWSDDLCTLAHYYEGTAIKATIKLKPEIKTEYVCSLKDIDDLKLSLSEYTYGNMEMIYPKSATWYSFSSQYLKDYVIDIVEIFPDLTKYDDIN